MRLSGRMVLAVLAVAIAYWAVMVFGTLAHLRALAGGLDAFDLRPTGYGHAEALQLLTALGETGRDFYARVQLRLDMTYPALYALSRALLLWWLTAPGRIAGRTYPVAVRAIVLALPLTAAVFDYRENAAIAAMLASGPGLDPGLTATASLMTQVKSIAGLLTESISIILSVLACVGWWRRRAAA